MDADMEFHARKSAKRKTYCYTINANRYRDPLFQYAELHHPGSLKVDQMEAALRHLVGEHDFTSFCSIHAQGESRIRTIYEAKLVRELVPGMEKASGNGVIRLFITGNGFASPIFLPARVAPSRAILPVPAFLGFPQLLRYEPAVDFHLLN